MAGAVIERQLIAPPANHVRFAVANRQDDRAIRQLLRENPMNGGIALTFEREPDYFRSLHAADIADQTIVAFEGERLICMGRCSVRRGYVNGEPYRLGYLADLRLAASARSRFDILRRGYRFFHEQQQPDPADFYFTSIAVDNDRSIRFLERGLPGMPRYEVASDFVTVLIPVPHGERAIRQIASQAKERAKSHGLKSICASKEHIGELVSCLNFHAARYQFASHWQEDELHSLEDLGLIAANFQLVLSGDKVIACAALWDQRQFKQTVIRGYSAKVSLARPWINLAGRLFGMPRLPPVNSPLAFAFISPFAVQSDDTQALLVIVESSLAVAAKCSLEYIVIGFASDDPRLAVVRDHFRCREFRTRLYCVHWPDAPAGIRAFDGRLFLPDIALL